MNKLQSFSCLVDRVREALVEFQEDHHIDCIDERTANDITTRIYVLLPEQEQSALSFQYFTTQFLTPGLLVVIATQTTVHKTVLSFVPDEMAQFVIGSQHDKLEYIDKFWKLSTPVPMIVDVLQEMMNDPQPSYHLNFISLCLQNVSLLSTSGKSFALPCFATLPDQICVICWYVQDPEIEILEKYASSDIIEFSRIPIQLEEEQKMTDTIDLFTQKIIERNQT